MASPKRLISLALFLVCSVMGAGGPLSDASDATYILTTSSGVHLTESSRQIIESMASVAQMPSCNKVASAALKNTCSEIDIDTSLNVGVTVDVMLEKSKSIYAARLAVCELIDAHASIPRACAAFQPSEDNTWRSYILPKRSRQYPAYDHDTAQQLKPCLKALSSTPQLWTSYSNAKQNSILMCHAMRASIDKGGCSTSSQGFHIADNDTDEKLELFQMMTELNEQTMGAMSVATRDFEGFLKDFAVIRKDMQSFQLSLNTGIVDSTELLEKYWAGIHGHIQNLDYSLLTTLEVYLA